MIRVYVALFCSGLVGLGLASQHGPVGLIGEMLVVLCAIGLHAHYTGGRS